MAHRSIPKGPAGVKCRRGRQNSRFSTNIWLSVDNSCSANNNCYGDRSGSGSLSGNVLQRMSRHTVVTVNSDGGTCNAESVHNWTQTGTSAEKQFVHRVGVGLTTVLHYSIPCYTVITVTPRLVFLVLARIQIRCMTYACHLPKATTAAAHAAAAALLLPVSHVGLQPQGGHVSFLNLHYHCSYGIGKNKILIMNLQT